MNTGITYTTSRQLLRVGNPNLDAHRADNQIIVSEQRNKSAIDSRRSEFIEPRHALVAGCGPYSFAFQNRRQA